MEMIRYFELFHVLVSSYHIALQQKRLGIHIFIGNNKE